MTNLGAVFGKTAIIVFFVAFALATAPGCGQSAGTKSDADLMQEADGVGDAVMGDTLPTDGELLDIYQPDLAGDAMMDSGEVQDADSEVDWLEETFEPDSLEVVEPDITKEEWRLKAEVSCELVAPACGGEPALAPAGNYRSDFYYPFEEYPELGNQVIEGGRVQLAGVAEAGGLVIKVEIDGTDVTPLAMPANLEDVETPEEVLAITDTQAYHWVQVWPFTLVEGKPFLLNFHVGTLGLEEASQVQVKVTTEEGVALEGNVELSRPLVPLTWVTTNEGMDELLMFARNEGGEAQTLSAIELDGVDVTSAVCVPRKIVEPGESVFWRVKLCEPAALGDVWTLVVRFEGGAVSVGTGRFVIPHFPIHSWVKEKDCPYPGANWANYMAHRERGFDMPFMRGKFTAEGCNNATSQSIVEASKSIPDQYFLLDEWAEPGTDDFSRVARLLGDEVDSNRDDKPFRVSRDAKRSWTQHPGMTTYIGAARHRPNGAFAGIADIQGMDIYFASCAPSILSQMLPGLRAPYDYFRAVIRNQRPNTTWFYSQGIHDGWVGTPNAPELMVSAMSVVVSGAKGLMYFMTNMKLVEKYAETWEAMGRVNREIRSIRRLLREGDATGGAKASAQEVLIEAIRSKGAIVVPLVNVSAEKPLDFTRCIIEGEDAHWVFADVATDVTVEIPLDFSVGHFVEVVGTEVVTPDLEIWAQGRTIHIKGVTMSEEQPYRILVLASDQETVDGISADMVIPEVTQPEVR